VPLYFAIMNLNSTALLARRLINTTTQLVLGPNTYTSIFARAIEGTFRRDYLTLYTMLLLTERDDPAARRAFGDSCLDLSRRVIEDLISLEYMIFKGKEKYALKFFEYQAIEAKQDLDFLEAIGAPIDEEFRLHIEENYNKIKRKFLDGGGRAKKKAWTELTEYLISQGKIDQQTQLQIDELFEQRYPNTSEQPRRAWAGLDTEAMIEELVSGGVISAKEKRSLSTTYILGNRKNHFSPTDIRSFLHNDPDNKMSEANLAISLTAVITSVTRMAMIFASEFDVPEHTKQEIDAIWQILFAARLSEKE
jgi:hypothetical protein